jgi:hypothetical protein
VTATMLADVREEFGRAFKPPYEVPFVVVVNGLLMAGAWFWLPPAWLFHLHEARVFPLVLASWMYADVPATNVLGSAAERMGALLDKPAELRRALAAKTIVLWALVTPICLVVCYLTWRTTHESVLSMLASMVILAVVPFGALGLAGWLGIWFPYHALRLADRWEHRRPYGRMIVRWSALVLIPYVLVPPLSVLVLAPVLLGWRAFGESWLTISDRGLALGAVVLVVLSAVVWRIGLAVGVRMAGRRRARLGPFLADPLAG